MPRYPYSGAEYSARFWKKVLVVEDEISCWIWQAAKNKAGYGIVGYKGYTENAHRVAWIITFGEITSKFLFVCHKCNTKSCVRPSHLYLADNQRNQLDYQRDKKRG